MIIDTNLLRAALVCVAKDDLRYYLCGLHITPKYIEATNGHVALRLEHGVNTRRETIIQFHGKVPRKAKATELHFTKEPYAVHRDISGTRVGFNALSVLDGRFPDLNRVIPEKVENVIPHFQACYLAYPYKMFGADSELITVSMHPSGMKSGCLMTFGDNINQRYGNPQLVVMPCRT
ncbi:hypothetical protein B5C26_17850 [Photorhabdus luminescens]|uniref:hypothetical protein n=1 Tax=Photorhabdus luminescens TaxID=29488 RepID=UPI000B4C4DFE|nr:hypothetical protein [Photorhabdus luminescens]OWO80642.1 hypothetical protein B5C26_17850 [Photorhabdus luminescens]